MCCIIVLRLLGPLIKFQCSSMSICGAENFFFVSCVRTRPEPEPDLRPGGPMVRFGVRKFPEPDQKSGPASSKILSEPDRTGLFVP